MAAILASQITLKWIDTGGQVALVYRITGVTSGDTLDTSTTKDAAGAALTFRKLTSAVFGPCGPAGATAGTAATLANGSTGTNTQATFTLTSLANDTIDVMLHGM